MNKRKGLRTLTSIMLVFFLFAPVVIRAVQAYSEGCLKRVGLTKSSGTPTKADSQLLFEEKEKEEKGANQITAQLPLIYVIAEFFLVTAENAQSYSFDQGSCNFQGTPLYLAKRALLIWFRLSFPFRSGRIFSIPNKNKTVVILPQNYESQRNNL